MRPGSSASETPLTAATPPKRFTIERISRMGAIRLANPLDGPGQVVLLLEHAQDSTGHQEHHPHDDRAEEELVEVDETCPHHLLEGKEHRGAEHRSPDRPLAAEQ